MWSNAVALIKVLWVLLPEITLVLRFLTALIGFIVAMFVLARQLRRCLCRRRSRR